MENQQRDSSSFEFDKWAGMAADDPDTFEAMRRAAIDEVIASAPESSQPRLRGLQWRIDQERRRARTPLAACIRISQMMWESVTGESGLLRALRRLQGITDGGAADAVVGDVPRLPREAVVVSLAERR